MVKRCVVCMTQGFQGMTEGVTEIEGFAYTLFARVSRHNLLFDGYAVRNERREGVYIHRIEVVLQEAGPEFRVGDEAGLEHLGEAA